MLDLNKLTSQFDINNLDLTQIPKFLAEHQKIVKIAFGIISLLIALGMFNEFHTKEQGLRTRISQEQAKLAVIKARDAAIQNLTSFKSSIPKELNVFDLITLISKYAKSSQCVVASYSPSLSKDMGLYSAIDVRLDMATNSFKSMILFLRKIEKSNYPIRIDTWSASEGDDGRITFSILICAVHLHP